MSISSLDLDFSAEQLARLEATLSGLGVKGQKGKPTSNPAKLDDLKQAVVLIRNSISELQRQIDVNQERQKELAAKSQELKEDIRKLTNCIANEVSQLVSASERL
jgi:peptidoglycan hydrolase CwlO-like protein